MELHGLYFPIIASQCLLQMSLSLSVTALATIYRCFTVTGLQSVSKSVLGGGQVLELLFETDLQLNKIKIK